MRNAVFWNVTPFLAFVRTDLSKERRFLQEPHGVASQKAAFITATAVKTSNLRK
jgi:hypothetical protein